LIPKLVAAASLMLTAPVLAQDVSYDYDRTTDFTQLKTYAWVDGSNLKDELNHKRIVDAIDTQLRAKGMTRVQVSDNPDVLVAYHASFNRDLEINGYGGYRWGPGLRSARVEQVTVGTLVVDLVNAKTKTIVWRGVARKDLDPDASPEKRDKNINKAAQKLFKNYPYKA
jgi:hypothetical protein